MALIRTKNNVPQPYVSESRDFQLMTRVLDFVQNSIKFDIDSITNVVDTDLISSNYLDRLKSKLGFFTSNTYDDNTLRIVLSAFPHIMRYKGSEEGVKRCVNTYLNIAGVSGGSRIDIYNNNTDHKYTVRIGISGAAKNTNVLKDMMSYILPSGYAMEIYSYKDSDVGKTLSEFDSVINHRAPDDSYKAEDFASIRVNKREDNLENDTYNTVHLSALHDEDE